MKWKKTRALIFFAVLFETLAPSSFAEEQDPWGFQNIAVINLPTRRVALQRSLDRKAVEIKFQTWEPALKKVIEHSLSESPLSFRMFPARQSAMLVEVYSATTVVDFAERPQKGGMQIIIGEVRNEAAASKLLNMEKSALPIPDVAELVRAGQYSLARHELYKRSADSRADRLLLKARVSLIDYLRRGRGAGKCPRMSAVSSSRASDLEALLLNAWCEKEHGNTPKALYYSDILKSADPQGPYRKQAEFIERIIVSSQILSSDRMGNTIPAAAFAIENMDIVTTLLSEFSFVETVANNLMEVGLAGPLAKVIQDSMAREKNSRRSIILEPVLVESYLAGNDTILAMDSATYFLSKRQPPWNTARLRRALGISLLQAGNWKDAQKALSTAKAMGAAWDIDDELSLIESGMRARIPNEKLDKLLEDFINSNPKLKRYQKKWFSRLALEIGLQSEADVSKEALSVLPGYVLYEKAIQMKEAGNRARYMSILEKMTSRSSKKSGWKDLAKISLEVEEMRETLNEIKAIMREMQ